MDNGYAPAVVRTPPSPIDVVVTWVDDRDPSWQREFETWSDRIPADATADARDPARYRDHGELRYVLRSIVAFAPWVRTIHVVTAGQRPPGLRAHPRLRIVDHRQLFETDCLPTFNSHAIESRLHHVPDLADRFIYFNDDVVLARPQSWGAFFTPDGRPRVAVSEAALPTTTTATDTMVDHSALACLRLLAGDDDARSLPARRPSHGPFALRRRDLLALEQRFADAFAATARRRFRTADDIAVPTFLAPVLGLAEGTAELGELVVDYVGLDDDDLDDHLAAFATGPTFDALCVNDTERVVDAEERGRRLRRALRTRLPVPAPWEDQGRRSSAVRPLVGTAG